MRKLFTTVVILSVCATIAHACLNHYHTVDKDGNLHAKAEDDVLRGFNTNFNRQRIEKKAHDLLQKLIVEKSYIDLSDYAVMMMKLGKNKEALQVLKVLYAHYPEEYQLASNLGTSYELDGQNDSALKYIRRGMELYPQEHRGSEWVHVKILEAKLRMKDDPDYLRTHRVLALTDAQLNDTAVGAQIELQVRERFPFCPGPDPVMGQLMTDLADITLNTASIEDAKAYYAIAMYYYGDSSETVKSKYAESQRLIAKHADKVPGRDRIADEGENVRLGPYKYTEMLDDNDDETYTIDWSGLPTDPATLLAYVDLTMPVEKAHELLNENPVIEEAVVAQPSGEKPADASGGIWFVLAALLPAVVYAVLLRK